MRTNNIIFLAIGGAIGFVAGMLVGKTKYQKIADEEIASVVEEFRGRKRDEAEKKEREEAEKITAKYSTESRELPNDIKSAPLSKSANIELITPEEFGNYIGEDGIPYEYAEYHCWSDGVVTNDEYDVCKDVDGTIGLKALNHFGDYEPARVFVRNHDLELDCELIKEKRRFEDLAKKEATYDYD